MNKGDTTNVGFVKFIEKYSPGRYSAILMLPIVLLVLGFLIWNTYLYTFGFVENEIIRSTFILTGFSFTIVSLILLGMLLAIIELVRVIGRVLPSRMVDLAKVVINYIRTKHALVYYLVGTIILLWFFFYILNIFPSVPVFLGGGQPRALSLIVDNNGIEILETLEIKMGDGAIHQTENLCIVHENNQRIYVLRSNRVLALDRSLFKGFGSLPGVRSVPEQECISYAIQWSRQGFYFGKLLALTTLENLVRRRFGMEQKFFDILPTQ